jgi:hypothetical protein
MRVRRLTNTLFAARRGLGLFNQILVQHRDLTTTRLPHLVFGDNHTDVIEQETLAELAPQLKAMGYKRVNLEFSDSEGWDVVEQYIETEQHHYQALKADFKKQKLDITNHADVEKYLHRLEDREFRKLDDLYHEGKINGLERLSMQDEVNTQLRSARMTIEYKNDTEALKKFVTTFKELGFECHNIDTDSDLTAACSDDEILRTMDIRSDAMATAMIATEEKQEPSITILGLHHLQRIQEMLIKKYGAKEAAEKYKFINITTPARERTRFEEKVSNGKVKFPLGLHQIDSDLQNRIKMIIEQQSLMSESLSSVPESNDHQFSQPHLRLA